MRQRAKFTMPRPGPFCLGLGVWLLALTFGWPLLARSPANTGQMCHLAAQQAAREMDVPLDLMLAIGLVESGIDRGQGTAPWPWTLHFSGKGHWRDTKAEAHILAQSAIDAGTTNIDLGCFQINYRWHGENFASLNDMLDPVTNARYAARLLRSHFERLGSWQAAAGAYHSATPDLAAAYLTRVNTRLGQAADLPPPTAQAALHVQPAPAPPLPATPGAIAIALRGPGIGLFERNKP
ncbi:MAG: lytic transglycosylase domain-containing protein [Roseinatronobacter sp.]